MRPTSPRSAAGVQEAPEIADLSNLRNKVAELEDELAARDELISHIGHELRNPLSPVFLQAYQVLSEVRKKPVDGSLPVGWLTPRLEMFMRGLERLLDRLNRLMDVAALQSEAGLTLQEEDDTDLTLIAAQAIESLSREAAAAAAPIELVAEGPVLGRWDRVRVEQIASNLVSNAIRFGRGKPIRVEVSAAPHQARLCVRDQGPGIAPEVQAHIFDRLRRPGPRPQKGGLGLGLWITHGLCEAMGGTIAIESQPGQGAEFVVTLPRTHIHTDE